jgi:Holliday junction DNA helicase RuvA
LIARIAGMLVEKRSDAAVVDVGGVGYLVLLSAQSAAKLGPPGSAVTLRTHTHVREDALSLIGFATEEEETLFHMLIGTSGVGPKLAINILSGMQAVELARALAGGELARLTKIPGVGKKTAERLVVELKDKLKTSSLLHGPGAISPAPSAAPGDSQLVSALLNLGYKPALVERKAESVRRALGASASVEAQLREALKLIQGSP